MKLTRRELVATTTTLFLSSCVSQPDKLTPLNPGSPVPSQKPTQQATENSADLIANWTELRIPNNSRMQKILNVQDFQASDGGIKSIVVLSHNSQPWVGVYASFDERTTRLPSSSDQMPIFGFQRLTEPFLPQTPVRDMIVRATTTPGAEQFHRQFNALLIQSKFADPFGWVVILERPASYVPHTLVFDRGLVIKDSSPSQVNYLRIRLVFTEEAKRI